MHYKKLIITLLVVISSHIYAEDEIKIENPTLSQVTEALSKKEDSLSVGLNKVATLDTETKTEKLAVIVYASLISNDVYGTNVGYYSDGSIVTYFGDPNVMQIVFVGTTPVSYSTVWDLVMINGVTYLKHYHIGYIVYTNAYTQYVLFP